MKKIFSFLIFWGMICIVVTQAQDDKQKIIRGNDAFNNKDYQSAAEEYSSASGSESLKDIANFNLGDALYRQGKFEEAAEHFGKVTREAEDPGLKSRAWHNLGNAQMSQQDYAKAMRSYKEALKLNPKDADSRYNLAYSRKMLQQQQQQQQQNQDGEGDENEKNQEQEGEQNKDQQNQDGDQEGENDQDGQQEQEQEGDQENQDGEQDQKEGEQDQNGQGQEGENSDGQEGEEQALPLNPDDISPEDAARILEALDKAEEELQGKLRKHKKGKGKEIDKDW